MKRFIVAVGASVALGLSAISIQPNSAVADDPTITIAAVGDMACDPSNTVTKYSAAIECQQQAVSDRMLADTSISAVLGLGDYQYDCGDLADYAVSYNPTWGRLDPLMKPSIGNHEIKTGLDAWGMQCPTDNSTGANYFAHFGAAAHPETVGHYSFDLGTWHFVALNADCSMKNAGGCAATSPQTTWLKADLAGTTQPCIAAYWHQPLYQGLAKDYVSTYKAWWDALGAVHADVVINGHIHNYQRFGPMDSAKHTTSDGITEYVVGTGGEAQVAMKSTGIKPAYWLKMFGYMKMTLNTDSWHTEFIDSTGVSHDSFDGVCHA